VPDQAGEEASTSRSLAANPSGWLAGMRHRIWNSSSSTVRYLDADIPAPEAYAKLAPAQ